MNKENAVLIDASNLGQTIKDGKNQNLLSLSLVGVFLNFVLFSVLFFLFFYFDLRNCVFVSVFGLMCVGLGRFSRS